MVRICFRIMDRAGDLSNLMVPYLCRRIYKNKINTHIHLKIRKFPLPDEIHVLIDDFVYSREFEDNMHISRSTYLSFSKTSYLRMVWYIGRRAAATVDPK